MKQNNLRLGIIGLSSVDSWAARAHVPAIKAAGGFAIEALSVSNTASARSAANHFCVPLFFGDHGSVVEHPNVDVVIVAVKVPSPSPDRDFGLERGQNSLLRVAAGKWTFRSDRDAVAAHKAVRGFVGLQGRSSPALRFVRDLIFKGGIGEVISTTLVAYAGAWADTIESRLICGLDHANGVSMLTVQFDHAVDGLC